MIFYQFILKTITICCFCEENPLEFFEFEVFFQKIPQIHSIAAKLINYFKFNSYWLIIFFCLIYYVSVCLCQLSTLILFSKTVKCS